MVEAGVGSRRGARGTLAQSAAPAALPAAAIHLDQSYTVQYIAHAPLEPRAAVAQWKDGKLTVWTGTQRPFGVKDELVAAFHLDPSQVPRDPARTWAQATAANIPATPQSKPRGWQKPLERR